MIPHARMGRGTVPRGRGRLAARLSLRGRARSHKAAPCGGTHQERDGNRT